MHQLLRLKQLERTLGQINSVTFTNGVWFGEVTILENGTNVVLTAEFDGGQQGESNPFDALRLIAPDLQIFMSASPSPIIGSNITYTSIISCEQITPRLTHTIF